MLTETHPAAYAAKGEFHLHYTEKERFNGNRA